MNNIFNSAAAQKLINAIEFGEIKHILNEEILSDVFLDIILYTSVFGVDEQKDKITYLLNSIMDAVDFDIMSEENKLMFYEISKLYDKLPFINQKNDLSVLNNC